MKLIVSYLKKYWPIFISVCFFLPVLVKQDLYFHTDIARDFLLLRDIVTNHKLTLIGPRSGGISGVFHGPLWLYLNAPVFYLSKGNPVALLYFWFFLSLVFLFVYWKILKWCFEDNSISNLSTLTMGLYLSNSFYNSFNPTGALLLSPLFVYFLYRYLINRKINQLISSLFVLGLIVQFQMAFAVPIMFSTFLLLLITKVKIKHLLSFVVVILPLSTFILFEFRHSFLQTKALFSYLRNSPKTNIDFAARVNSLIDSFQMFYNPYFVIKLALVVFIIYATLYLIKKSKQSLLFKIIAYFFTSFWIITLAYRGSIHNYYYLAFYPFIPIIIFSFIKTRFANQFYLISFCLLFFPVYLTVKNKVNFITTFSAKDFSSWQFNYQTIKNIFDNNSNFGIFFFSPDQYAYSQKYPFYYLNDTYNSAFPYQKMATTFVLSQPEVEDNPYINYDYWKKDKLNISKNASLVVNLDNGFKIEKFIFNQQEQNVEASLDTDLGLFFR